MLYQSNKKKLKILKIDNQCSHMEEVISVLKDKKKRVNLT